MGSEGRVETRRTSTVSSTSVRSSTSGGGSSWFGWSNIHHRASLSVYSEGDEGNEDSISEDVSLTKSDETSINME